MTHEGTNPNRATGPVGVDADGRHADPATARTPRTSAAAVFSLVLGLLAVCSVLTLVLAPVALVLAVVGIVLAAVGLRRTHRRHELTGRAVAITGMVLSVVALILSITALVGISTFLNDDAAVDRLERQVQQLRDDLPTEIEVPRP
jgi:Na+/melibiose symporter-like transporter